MGFAPDVGYLCMLTARNDDLMQQINQYSENLLQLQTVAGELTSVSANVLPARKRFTVTASKASPTKSSSTRTPA